MYVIGIDLGTTNSAVAYADLNAPPPENRQVRFLEIPQLVAASEMGNQKVLPSFLYLPGQHELPEGSTGLPWDPLRDYAAGEFAREQGSLVPGRLISSAKSWLCHGEVDRTAPILPWGEITGTKRLSPVEASSRYLRHMKEGWDQAMARGQVENRMDEQLVILTVPASFDEMARELTVEAAQKAGLTRIVIVEEPLAAFYAWLSRHESDWQNRMSSGQLILVCDVGGGTTDFTVIAVRQGEAGLHFDRLAVGNHLMLGGDNMDTALARIAEGRLIQSPGKLDSRQWHQLLYQCRSAKEALLIPGGPASFDVTVVGTGSRLIGGTRKCTFTREEVEQTILESFFPGLNLDEAPLGRQETILSETGLPFVRDTAVTRHLASFWNAFQPLLKTETGREQIYPDFILYNGGALIPESLRERLTEVVTSWFSEEAGPGWSPTELDNPSPELSVAIGAAYYGLVRQGEGVRVGAGTPRAFYVEVSVGKSRIESTTLRAVCLIPRGTEEGFEEEVAEHSFNVLTNQPVAFRIFTSSTRIGDRLGDLVELSAEETSLLPPVRTVLRYGRKAAAQALPIHLAVRLTEFGTLEIWCTSQQTTHRWRLQFDARQELTTPTAADPSETLEVDLIETARDLIGSTFRKGGLPPGSLTRELGRLFDLAREKWPTSVIRRLSDALLDTREARRISAHHEARWFNLLGFCLRPGFGDPVDEWRIKEVWKLFPAGLEHQSQAQVRLEWWVFWRRVAGGLSAGQQWHFFQQVSPALLASDTKRKRTTRKTSRLGSPQEETELWMALANFERLPIESKIELGKALLGKLTIGKARRQELWALSRLAARIPLYGPLDQVIPPSVAALWIETMLSQGSVDAETLAPAILQMARRTGDRARDLPQMLMDSIAEWLQARTGGERLRKVLTNPETPLTAREQEWVFGEGLPAGLSLDG